MLTLSDIKKIIRIIKWSYFWSYWNIRSSQSDGVYIPVYLNQLQRCISLKETDIVFCKRWKDICMGHDKIEEIRSGGDPYNYLNIEKITVNFFKLYPELLNKMPEHIKNKIMMLSI